MRYFKGLEHRSKKDNRVHWALMSSFDIPCEDGSLYLRRLRIIQTPWFGLYLHEMHAPDVARDLHDHPYNFYSIILKGGYVEYIKNEPDSLCGASIRTWDRWSGHLMKKNWAHRIAILAKVPTYTLVLVGRRTREWGFWTNKGWIKWDEYHTTAEGEQVV